MGDLPHWYRIVKAAQYLKVRPWELAEQPIYWTLVAEAASTADDLAAKRAEEQTKGKGR